jgi:glutamyl-tRNA synthetase
MSVFVRFAPSPTGRLHPGNARAAIINWLFARKHQGKFMLRMDDTDQERSELEYEVAIQEDLIWLGLNWDVFTRQTDRLDRYAQAFDHLVKTGRLYPCYETQEELSLMRKSLSSQGRPPVYDRSALKLSDADRLKLETQGRKPHWRFKLEDKVVAWDDMIRGSVRFEGAHSSDPVLYRTDGLPIYTLTSVVDDGELKITHIIRGEDHVTNTAAQVQLFEALGFAVPTFGHFTLFTDATGHGFSKRLGSLSLINLRKEGIEAMALNSLLAKLGTSDPIEPCLSLAALVEDFDIGKFGRGSPKFDDQDLLQLNAKIIHLMPFESVQKSLIELGYDQITEAFWHSVRPNLTYTKDVAFWWSVCHGDIKTPLQDRHFIQAAKELLPQTPWDQTTWSTWTTQVKEATGKKGKDLFLPLRLALTGQEHGPEHKELLPLMDRTKVLERLSA